jgi:hypothetical protein
MKLRQKPLLWRELPVHGVNALGICAFVAFMIHYPHFDGAGPPTDWNGLLRAMTPVMAWLYLPIFALDLLPVFLVKASHGSAMDYVLQPLAGGVIFGAVAVVLYAIGIWTGANPLPVSALEAGFGFLLHFIPVMLFEVFVRSVWLGLERHWWKAR